MSRLKYHIIKSSPLHQCEHTMIQQRPLSVYGYGTQWTGSLSRSANNSSFDDEAPEISPQEIAQLHQVQTMVQLNSSDIDWEREECVGASVGWGHSALLIQGKKSSNSNNTTRLMVCGRPHDFQTLMRLRRLPPFIRNFASSTLCQRVMTR